MFTIGGTSNREFFPFEPTGSLRFEDGDSPYLTRTPTTAGNRKTWTWSAWVKRGNLGLKRLFSAGTSGSSYIQIRFDTNDEILCSSEQPSLVLNLKTTQKFRDPSAWYHIVVVMDTTQSTAADRTKLYVNGSQVTDFSSSTRPTQNTDLLINSTTAHMIGALSYSTTSGPYDGYMAEINFIDGTALDADSFGETKAGIWIPKQYSGSYGTNGFYLPFNSTVTATGQSTVIYTGTGAGRSVEGMGYKPDLVWYKNRDTVNAHIIQDRVRGPSAYLVPSENYFDNNAGNILQAYTNDGFYYGTNAAGNNSGSDIVAWAWDAGADQTATGYGCVVYTGSATTRPVTDIGFSPDLVWIKARSNSYHPMLADSVRGAGKRLSSSQTSAETSDTNAVNSFGSDGFDLDTGSSINNNGDDFVAWCWDAGDSAPASNSNGTIPSTVKASTANGFSVITYTGNGTNGATVGHGLSSKPDLFIIKNRDASTNWIVYNSVSGATKNLVLEGTDALVTSSTRFNNTEPTNSVISLGTTSAVNGNSTDYVAYCWHSVSGYSKIGTYTGNGSASGPIVTCGFRPAFVMIKRADSTGSWYIFDVNRDPDNKGQRYLRPNSSAAEGGSGTGTEYVDFQSNGFQIIASGTNFGDGNTSGGTYLYMAFAGGKDTIAPVNTDGSITSRVKASDDTGFSIVQYEGTGSAGTIGHGLSSAPDWVLVKNRTTAVSSPAWPSWHTSLTDGGYYIDLATTAAQADGGTAVWNDTAPTNSVFSVGTTSSCNTNGNEYIAYCWTATTGKSAFGSYTGTGSAGLAVTGLGFKPAVVFIKRSDSAGSWYIHDSSRNPNNPAQDLLSPNNNDAEATFSNNKIDLDSDGFTVQGTAGDHNASGGTYLYMAFADGREASFFYDQSGNGNNFDPTGLQNSDVLPDSPTNNWCVLNHVNKDSVITLSEGNLKTGGGNGNGGSTFEVSSGKWYWEVRLTEPYASIYWGLHGVNNVISDSGVFSGGAGFYALNASGGGLYANGSVVTAKTSGWATGDIIGLAYDADSGTLDVYQNNSQLGSSLTVPDASNFPVYFQNASGADTSSVIYNFGQDGSFSGLEAAQGNTDDNGQGDFYHSPPSGFLALCTANLPDPAIDPDSGQEPEDYFNTVLYTGNGSTQSITGVGHQPDWVWIKSRSNTYSHGLFDSVRGATKKLYSNLANDEATESGVTSFDNDGFSLGSAAGTNNSGSTYVAWNWKLGGTAVSNTDGAITSSVSANTKAGVSIITWTGNGSSTDTVGHGLDGPLDMIIYRRRNSAPSSWYVVYNVFDGSLDRLFLEATNSYANITGVGDPLGATTTTNFGWSTGNLMVGYCFKSIDGFSKISTYAGNGSTDGSFVYTGFRPAWVMVKRIDSTGNWYIMDNKRNTFNAVNNHLYPNLSSVESASSHDTDFVSNGFKARGSAADLNASGGSYIYLAFAEQPFKYANAR
jgi:hypothetical protein